jgi:hypothetical protein
VADQRVTVQPDGRGFWQGVVWNQVSPVQPWTVLRTTRLHGDSGAARLAAEKWLEAYRESGSWDEATERTG